VRLGEREPVHDCDHAEDGDHAEPPVLPIAALLRRGTGDNYQEMRGDQHRHRRLRRGVESIHAVDQQLTNAARRDL